MKRPAELSVVADPFNDGLTYIFQGRTAIRVTVDQARALRDELTAIVESET